MAWKHFPIAVLTWAMAALSLLTSSNLMKKRRWKNPWQDQKNKTNKQIKKNRHSIAVALIIIRPAEKTLERVGQKFKHVNFEWLLPSMQGIPGKEEKNWGNHEWLCQDFLWWASTAATEPTMTCHEGTAMYLPQSLAPQSTGERKGANHTVMEPSHRFCGCHPSELLHQCGNLGYYKVHPTCLEEEWVPLKWSPALWGAPTGKTAIHGTLLFFSFFSVPLVRNSAIYYECRH